MRTTSHAGCTDAACQAELSRARAELHQASLLIGQLEARLPPCEQLIAQVSRRQMRDYDLTKELETVV